MTHEEITQKIESLLKNTPNPDLTQLQEECEKIGHIPEIDFASIGYTICKICMKII